MTVKTIETQLQVTADGQVVLPALPELTPGAYDVVLVIVPAQKETERGPLNFPVDDLGPWPEDLSLRREDMYDDDGR
jgi:hypothetical protein